jgi:hypothetical protein
MAFHLLERFRRVERRRLAAIDAAQLALSAYQKQVPRGRPTHAFVVDGRCCRKGIASICAAIS